MILNQFPDLQWLKSQIKQNFTARRGPGNLQLESDGFPSVIIHTVTKNTNRPNITGPVSLFMNISGTSNCIVDGKRMAVTEGTYSMSNRLQDYTLEINSDRPVETFNIHIGEQFYEKYLLGFLQTSSSLLGNGDGLPVAQVNFYNKLYKKNAEFNSIVGTLMNLEGDGMFNKMQFEETLSQLCMHLLQQHKNILAQIGALPPVKQAVRQELYKRIASATDYMHEHYNTNIQLDDIAAAACLSKFHFLRLFKQLHHSSPWQYIQQLRIEKAVGYLQSSHLYISDIATRLGYENSSSFSRIFRRHMGVYPSQYKQNIN